MCLKSVLQPIGSAALGPFGGALGGALGKAVGGLAGNAISGGNKPTTTFGTQRPILSGEYTDALNRARGNLNPGGYTADQATGVDFLRSNMVNNPVQGATTSANDYLLQSQNNYGFLNSQIAPFTTAPARQLGDAQLADYAGDIAAQGGYDFISKYNDPWQKDVIDSSIADYNVNADRALSGMRAGRDAAGAFGDRAAIADAVFQADSTRGLGSLVGGLRSQGFNTAAGFGQQDANRFLSAAQSNQSARAQNNQFNANMLDTRDKFNVDAGYRGDQQALQANEMVGQNVRSAADLQQQRLNNIIAADGIDVQKAQALFQAGSISQEQLNQILQTLAATNGSRTSQVSGQNLDPTKYANY